MQVISCTLIFVLVIVGLVFVNYSLGALPDGTICDFSSISNQIFLLQSETRTLCSHMNEITLPTANNFKNLMRNSRILCPNYTEMGTWLSHMENMGKEHHLLVEKQLKDCHALSNMVTNGLEHGGSAVFHLLQGNYSLFAKITNEWREQFTKSLTTHYSTKPLVERMLDNSHVFYHNGSILTVETFLIKVVVLLSITTLLTLILTWNSWLSDAARILYQFINSYYENQLFTRAPWVEFLQNLPIDLNNSFTDLARRLIEKHIRMIAVVLYAFIQILIWFFVLSGILAGSRMVNYDVFAYSKPIRYNWYPDAQSALEMMKNDTDSLAVRFTHSTHSIVDIQSLASTHHDMAVQAVVDDLKRSLVHVFRRVNQEMLDAYSFTEKISSRVRRACKNIDEKAQKAARLVEVNGLLVEVGITVNSFEALHNSLAVFTKRQQGTVSSLIERANSIPLLLKENRLIELGHVIKDFQDALVYIDGNTSEISIAANQVFERVHSGQLCGMKSTVASLIDNSVYDQVRTIILGATTSITISIVGVLNIRTGYVMAENVPSIIKGPALVVSIGLVMVPIGAYWGLSCLDGYIEISRYKSALALLEIERANVEIAMEKLKKAIDDQYQSSKSSQSILSAFAKSSGLFH